MQKSHIIDEGWIEKPSDLVKLDIIDWNRLINYWDNTNEAIEAVSSWLLGHTHYAIFEFDLRKAPERSDWPGWKHIGDHPEMGKLYWNWFYSRYQGDLKFSDSPDFHGEFHFKDGGNKKFYGDVGKVSPPTFIRTMKAMFDHEIWISIVDAQTQVVLEPTENINKLWCDFVAGRLDDVPRPQETPSDLMQLKLF